jgi:dTDP-4-dehydrorhamnose 3,5-epimerase
LIDRQRGTLRGVHDQITPREEEKPVRCTVGVIYDVNIDLRPESPTFRQWSAVELTADNRRRLFIPTGFVRGFQPLVDDTEVFYQMSEGCAAESARRPAGTTTPSRVPGRLRRA